MQPGGVDVSPSPIRLGARPVETVHFIARLRDNLTDGTTTRWHGDVTSALPTPLLWHLPPPVYPRAGLNEQVDMWRSRFRFGLCYYRLGPDFIHVKDIRNPKASASFVLDQPVLTQVFAECLSPRHFSELRSAQQEAAEALIGEGLLLRLEDHIVTLPSRMLHWPVPATEV